MNKRVPSVTPKSSTFIRGFSESLIYCLKKKNQFFKKHKECKSDYCYSIFSCCGKLVKTTIKAEDGCLLSYRAV
jgi:hypothetical protein